MGNVDDRDRPAYHIHARPEEGVCCPYDPNGAIYWRGRYHLMYIYQDPARPHGGHCWGHLSSADLVNWTYHPPALVPEPDDPDTGIFSGNAFVNKDGVPMLCWFGVDAGVCVATALDDDLITWEKHPGSPIIPVPKPGEPGHGVYTVWDPYLWLEDGTYRCLLGGNRLPNGKDTLYLCRSDDLIDWEMAGPFYDHADPGWTEEDEDCSCPDFFRLGDRRVLLCISHKIGARCYIGRYEGERFFPEQHVRMNWPGAMFFAPESLEDDRGRRIFWAWATDPRIGPAQKRTGSGTMSLPRRLSLAEDETLRIVPAPELEALRRNHRRIEGIRLGSSELGSSEPAESGSGPGELVGSELNARQINGSELGGSDDVSLGGLDGDRLELAAEIDPGSVREAGLKVRCSPDGTEETVISYDAAHQRLRIDMSRSTLRTDVTYGQPPFAAYGMQDAAENAHPYSCVEAPFALTPGETLQLRVFLDGPVLEVFANDRQCVTQMIYPSRPDSTGVRAFARGGEAVVRSLDAWEMTPASFHALSSAGCAE